VLGKPNPAIYHMALARLQTDPGHTLVVGDRLDTDIAGGVASGCRTALVLSGDIQQKDVDSSDIRPDLIAPDLTSLLETLLAVA
jgi:4-nitrophenyl phosphatase